MILYYFTDSSSRKVSGEIEQIEFPKLTFTKYTFQSATKILLGNLTTLYFFSFLSLDYTLHNYSSDGHVCGPRATTTLVPLCHTFLEVSIRWI